MASCALIFATYSLSLSCNYSCIKSREKYLKLL